MKLRFEVDQADSFRRGIDRPKSIVSIDINPADLPEETRSLIADHLAGIDVLQFFFHNGEVIKGYPIPELSCTSREPKRIVAKTANLDGLLAATRANATFIDQIQKSFDKRIQFRILQNPPKNEGEYEVVSDQRGDQLEAITGLLRQKRRVAFACFIHDLQTKLNAVLHAHSYVVYSLPLPSSTAQARFYCEPTFAAEYLGRQIVAHSPIIVLNEKTGRLVECGDLFRALDIYLCFGTERGSLLDHFSILSWQGGNWTVINPDGLISLANDRKVAEALEE